MNSNNHLLSHYDRIRNICYQVLKGELDLKNLKKVWPFKDNSNVFINEIYRDLTYAIEHTPGSILLNRIDHKLWKTCDEYFVVYLDYLLFGYTAPLEILQKCRSEVLKEKELTVELISNQVKQYFSHLL